MTHPLTTLAANLGAALAFDAGRRAAAREVREALDYSLADLPPGREHRTCDTRLWRANMAAYRLATKVIGR